MKQQIDSLLYDRGTDVAIEFALAQPDVAQAVAALDELMRDLYWKRKDLASSIKLGGAAAAHALRSANLVATEQHDLADKLRGMAKALYYNIASMTWRGWNEKDIDICPAQEAMGLNAAGENLRLGIELKRGNLPLSRAHWMLGAQQISAGDLAAARVSFGNGADHARKARESGDEWLCESFSRLTTYLAQPDDASLDSILKSIAELMKVNDGEFFAGQIATALRVYQPQCKRLSELNDLVSAKQGAS